MLCCGAQGYAANFVETEQLVTLDDGRVVASYVQVRRGGVAGERGGAQAGVMHYPHLQLKCLLSCPQPQSCL